MELIIGRKHYNIHDQDIFDAYVISYQNEEVIYVYITYNPHSISKAIDQQHTKENIIIKYKNITIEGVPSSEKKPNVLFTLKKDDDLGYNVYRIEIALGSLDYDINNVI